MLKAIFLKFVNKKQNSYEKAVQEEIFHFIKGLEKEFSILEEAY